MVMISIVAAVITLGGAALWLRRGRRTFGVAMDIAFGLAVCTGLASRDNPIGFAALALGIAAAWSLLVASRPFDPGTV